jgi:hypothetical protein
MLGARARFLSLALLVTGCGGSDGSATKTEQKGTPTVPSPEATKGTPEQKAAPEQKGTPEQKAAPEPFVPAQPLPEITVTKPAAPCAELPALPGDASEARKALEPYAVALRRLACEPDLFAKSSTELAKALGLPADAKLEFSDLRGVRLELPGEPTVADVAAVFGIAEPRIHLKWQAYHPMTSLGTNPTTGAFDLWGPGKLWIGVENDVDRYGDDAGKEEVLPAPPETRVEKSVIVSMPDDVVAMAPDADAIPLVVAALEKLAARPQTLAGKPEDVATEVGLAGERFTLAETSSHSGDTVTRGVSIAPRRTTLPAPALAAALGLSDAKAICDNREHDKWSIKAGETTEIAWKGLVLDLWLSSPESDEKTVPLDGLEVTFIRVMPAKT